MEFLELLETILTYIPPEYASVRATAEGFLPYLLLAVTLLTCFFGHKIHRLWNAFFFFFVGFFAGCLTILLFPQGTDMGSCIMLGLILGVLCGYYSKKLFRLELFFMNSFLVYAVLPGLLGRFLPELAALLLSLAVAVAAGVLASRSKHLVTIVTSSVSCGLSAAPMVFSLLGYENQILALILGALLALAGLVVQLLPEWSEFQKKRREAKKDAPAAT